jgi:hypothetical protein
MRWLTLFLLVLALPSLADEITEMPQVEDPAQKVIPLPFMMQCTPVPADEMLENLYGELGFLEGTAQVFKPDMTTANGKLRMFVDPDETHSYTIMIEFGPNLHCMIMSGDNLGPMIEGTKL